MYKYLIGGVVGAILGAATAGYFVATSKDKVIDELEDDLSKANTEYFEMKTRLEALEAQNAYSGKKPENIDIQADGETPITPLTKHKQGKKAPKSASERVSEDDAPKKSTKSSKSTSKTSTKVTKTVKTAKDEDIVDPDELDDIPLDEDDQEEEDLENDALSEFAAPDEVIDLMASDDICQVTGEEYHFTKNYKKMELIFFEDDGILVEKGHDRPFGDDQIYDMLGPDFESMFDPDEAVSDVYLTNDRTDFAYHVVCRKEAFQDVICGRAR